MTEPTTDAAPRPEKPADETAALRARAEKAEQERDQYLTLAKQTRADFENYQKRQQRDLADERRYAQRPLAQDLLAALDNLDRAMVAAKKAGETGPLVQGVAMVQSQLLDVLRRHGVTRIEALHQPFDPHLHEAVTQQPSAEHPAMTVLDVLQQGFTLHDRVLRPASVVVSTPADKTK
jgi:molecular chaperone GrpE